MTNQTEQGVNGADTARAAVTSRTRTPSGQRLPQATFAEVRPYVEALARLNGPASRNLIFSEAGKAGTGGAADRRWAAIGYYGFRQSAGGTKHEISDRGRAFLSGERDAALQAQQDAVAGTGFRRIVHRFSSRPVSKSAIAGLLHEDLGVPQDRTEGLADLLITISTEAGLISDDVFQVAAIERALEAVGETAERAVSNPSIPRSRTPKRSMPPTPTPVDSPVITRKVPTEGQAGPFEVSVEIKIETQHHSPDEVGHILREVRQALAGTAE